MSTGTISALQYRRSIPRYFWVGLTGKRFPRRVTGWGSCLTLKEVPTPRLPTPSWVRVRPLLSGICGSDLAVLSSSGSRYLSALTSFPFTPGHELVGEVTETGQEVSRVRVGDRVVLEPALGCAVRGFEEPCRACGQGRYANCERITEGDIGPGIQTGYCHDTGGGWGAELVAHESQLHPVPPGLPNEAAVLVEPLSCALHGVLQAHVGEGAKVLVMGCGSMGLMTIAALRAFGPACTIVAVAKHPHQGRWARSLGADHVVPPGPKGYEQLAELVGGRLHPLTLEKPAVVGGADVTFECVGATGSLEDALRWTRAGGTMVLVGMPGVPKLDLAPLWYQELRVVGAYAYGTETVDGREARTFELTLELLERPGWAQRLGDLVGHRFPLRRYKDAIATAMQAGRSEAVKVAFDFTDEGSSGRG